MARDVLTYAIGNAASTTLSSTVTGSDTSFPLTSDTSFNAKSGEGMVLLDEGAATEEIAYATTKSGGALTIPLANRGLEGGSAQGHSSGTSVKGILSASMWNDLIDSLTNVLVKSTGAVNSAKVPVISGGNATTLTTTGSTNVTLPTTGTLSAIAGTETLTNKRITKRITTISSSATPTVNTDNCDCVTITAQAAAITSMTTNLSGTPTNFQTLIYRIKDDGTGRAITWGSSFEAKGTALPTTTVASKVLTVGFIYDTVTSKWGCVASQQET